MKNSYLSIILSPKFFNTLESLNIKNFILALSIFLFILDIFLLLQNCFKLGTVNFFKIYWHNCAPITIFFLRTLFHLVILISLLFIFSYYKCSHGHFPIHLLLMLIRMLNLLLREIVLITFRCILVKKTIVRLCLKSSLVLLIKVNFLCVRVVRKSLIKLILIVKNTIISCLRC